jgi:hypothetical protein
VISLFCDFASKFILAARGRVPRLRLAPEIATALKI